MKRNLFNKENSRKNTSIKQSQRKKESGFCAMPCWSWGMWSYPFSNMQFHPNPPSILACRHGNMHMCCIHFSNKKKKKRLWWERCGAREACVLCLHPHPDLSDRPARLPPPPPFSSQLCISLLRVTCSFSKIPSKSRLQRQRWSNNGIETQYRRGANMGEICHLYHNRNDVGSRGGMKKCSRQPVIPGESGRFHLRGARLSWHEIFLHITKSVTVSWSELHDILPHAWTFPQLS